MPKKKRFQEKFLITIQKKELTLLRQYAQELSIKLGVTISLSALIRQGIKKVLKDGGMYDRYPIDRDGR